MPFVSAPGIEGQLYIPEKIQGCRRKHDCKDCMSCMICNDDKCAMCREQILSAAELAGNANCVFCRGSKPGDTS